MILLDTHVALWWADDAPFMSAAAARAIAESSDIGVCAVSAFEIATLARRRRVQLSIEPATWWFALVAKPDVTVIATDSSAGLAAGSYDETCPGDPIDRLLLATARSTGRRLVTADRRLREFAPADTLW